MEVVQDLDQSVFETRNLQAVLNTSYKTNGVDFRADVLE